MNQLQIKPIRMQIIDYDADLQSVLYLPQKTKLSGSGPSHPSGLQPQNNMRSTNYIRDKHWDTAGRHTASDVGVGVWQVGLGCGSNFTGHRIVLQFLG